MPPPPIEFVCQRAPRINPNYLFTLHPPGRSLWPVNLPISVHKSPSGVCGRRGNRLKAQCIMIKWSRENCYNNWYTRIKMIISGYIIATECDMALQIGGRSTNTLLFDERDLIATLLLVQISARWRQKMAPPSRSG